MFSLHFDVPFVPPCLILCVWHILKVDKTSAALDQAADLRLLLTVRGVDRINP